jgi:hypothetical protein
MDPDADPDPAIFIIDLQDATTNFKKQFFCLLPYFLKVHHFSEIKSAKEVSKQ